MLDSGRPEPVLKGQRDSELTKPNGAECFQFRPIDLRQLGTMDLMETIIAPM
jgi:hypothetical protein